MKKDAPKLRDLSSLLLCDLYLSFNYCCDVSWHLKGENRERLVIEVKGRKSETIEHLLCENWL